MKLAAILCVLLLAACQTMLAPEPPPVPAMSVTIPVAEVPVAAPCKPDIPPEPVYPDTAAALIAAPFPAAEKRLMDNPMDTEAMRQVLVNLRYRVQLLAAGWPLKNTRLAELNAAIKGCGG